MATTILHAALARGRHEQAVQAAAMTSADEFRKATTAIAAYGRVNGHDLHPWRNDGSTSRRTACRRCGGRFAVTVTASKHFVIWPEGVCP
jgi:hypothetical protein